MASKTRVQLEKWIRGKAVFGKVIDIGGSQLPLDSKRVKFAGETEVTILDLKAPHKVEKAPQVEWDLNVRIDENFPRHDLKEYFDYAACLEVSEYWYNPLVALKNINDLLKRDATLFISFHFVYPVHNPVEADFLRYTHNGAVKLLEEAGFEIVEITPRTTQSNLLDAFYAMDQMRPASGCDHKEIGTLIECKKK